MAKRDQPKTKICPQCKGVGEVTFVDSKGKQVPQICPTCYGSGMVLA